MTTPHLSLEGFKELLDRFGGDKSSWPMEYRTKVDALLADSEDARTMLADAVRLDAALASPPKAPPGLADRIVAAAQATPPGRKT